MTSHNPFQPPCEHLALVCRASVRRPIDPGDVGDWCPDPNGSRVETALCPFWVAMGPSGGPTYMMVGDLEMQAPESTDSPWYLEAQVVIRFDEGQDLSLSDVEMAMADAEQRLDSWWLDICLLGPDRIRASRSRRS